MKEQLTKFKTQYDIHADYNRKGLLQAKKDVYKSEIDCKNHITTRSQIQFTLKTLDIGFLQSLTLKDDPKFIQIQKTFSKYNTEVLSLKENPSDGLHLKKVVMDSMLKFLRMMMLAPDCHSKRVILDLAYYWFIKHMNPKSQRKPQSVLLKQIKQIISDHNLLPKAVIDKELPSSKVMNDLREYKIRARTQYPELDAPEFQLQNYHIHKVTYMNQKTEVTETEEDIKKRKLMRVQFPKPNLDQYYIHPEEDIKDDQKIEIPPLDPSVQQAGEEGQKPQQEGQKLPQQGQPLVPQEPQENAEQMELLNQMGGGEDEPQQVVIEEDEDKKKGKLDPFVKVFLRKQLMEKEKLGSFEYPPINQLERYKNHYKQALQRQDEIFSRKMNEWASKKSKFKTQISRKVQSIKMYHNQTVTLPPENPNQSFFYQTRINEAVRDGRKYLKGELTKESLNTEGSLSCFDRRRAKTLASSTNKPFSQIIQENRRVYQREDSLYEIQKIKDNFAKKKIFTSMQTMKGGLMHPQERDGEQQLQKVEYPVSLLSNPFFPKKKKKKGKKKKK